MLEKKVKYTDYKGNQREETCYFNISRAEAVEMDAQKEGGLIWYIQKITAAQNGPELFQLFKGLILGSYGVMGDDGRRFIKSKELSEAFSQTEAYSEVLMELIASDDPEKAVAAFIAAIMPKVD